MRALNRADGGGEVGDLGRLVGFHRAGLSALDTIMRRQLELYACALGPGAAVLDVMGESFLPAVEIDSGDALARLKQRHRDVQRYGGFSRTTLLACEYDHVRRLRSFLDRLDQHDAGSQPPTPGIGPSR
jgi:hypothetical protein